MKKNRKIVRGNQTVVDKDEKVTPILNESFPAIDLGDCTDAKMVDRITADDARRLRDFSIENKK